MIWSGILAQKKRLKVFQLVLVVCMVLSLTVYPRQADPFVFASALSDTSSQQQLNRITTSDGAYIPLDFIPKDNLMDPQRPIIYMTNPAEQAVIALNYLTGEKKSIAFDNQPEQMKIHNDEIYITLAAIEGVYQPFKKPRGAVAIINLRTFEISDQITLENNPSDVILDHNGYIYVLSKSGYPSMTSYSRQTLQQVDSTNGLAPWFGDYLSLENRIFYTSDSSSSDFFSYTVSKGKFIQDFSWNNYEQEEYRIDPTHFKLSPDGKYIFSNRVVYDQWVGRIAFLNSDSYDVAFDLENSRFFAVGASRTITVYDYKLKNINNAPDYPYFQSIGSFKMAGSPYRVFYQENHFVSLSTIYDNQYFLEIYDLAPNSLPASVPKVPANLTRQVKIRAEDPSGIIPLGFDPKDSLLDPSQPVIYMTDPAGKKIAAVNYLTQEVKTLAFTYMPEQLEYFNGELYVSLTQGHHSNDALDVPGAVGIINTQSFQLIDVIDVDSDPLDIAVRHNSDIYVFFDSGANRSQAYQRSTKQKIIDHYLPASHVFVMTHPQFDRFYLIEASGSNRMRTYYPENGALSREVEFKISDHQSAAAGTFAAISPDGKYLFRSSGQVYDTLLNEITQLNSGFNSLAFDGVNKRFFTGENNRLIVMYNASLNFNGKFQYLGSFQTVGNTQSIFYRDQQLISVSTLNQENFIEIYSAPHDTLPQTSYQAITKISNYSPPVLTPLQVNSPKKFSLDFEPSDFLLDSDNQAYFTDPKGKRLVCLDLTNGRQRDVRLDALPLKLSFESGRILVMLCHEETGSNPDSVVVVNPQTLVIEVSLGYEDDDTGQTGVSSPDGQYVFRLNGDVQNQYAVTITKLENQFSDIVFDLSNKRFFTTEGFHMINMYDYNRLNLSGSFHSMARFSTQGVMTEIEFVSNNLVALTQSPDQSYAIEIYTIPPGTYPLTEKNPPGRGSLPDGVLDSFPLPGTNNLPINSPIVIQFKQNIALGQNPERIIIEDGNLHQIPTSVHVSDNVLVVLPKEDLAYQSEYRVIIPADLISVEGQPEQKAMSSDFIFYFATGAEFNRLGGNDRIETSIRIAQEGWDTSSTVVLATSIDFPDALCAAPLAQKYDAPILLNGPQILAPGVRNELKRLQTNKVVIIGGYGAISQRVEDEIRGMGIMTERLKGDDRYQTSLAIAKNLDVGSEVFVATGNNFPDALSIASYAADKGIPILLTPSKQFPGANRTYMASYGITKAIIIGGENAVSSSIENNLPNPERISGQDRYETNYKVLAHFEVDYSRTFFATGLNFPDALSGSALAGREHSPIILVPNQSSQEWAGQWQPYTANMKMKYFLGGEGVVPSSTVKAIF